jgi:hypothetical protein
MPTVHHAIDVAASPEVCWQVFADLQTWPRWFPMLERARPLDGEPWRLGARLELLFTVGALSLPVITTVREIDPARRVRWQGGRLGIAGDHWYTFESKAAGTTRFTSHEDLTGPAARFIPRRIFDRIDGEVHQSMARFKSLVEGGRGKA